MFSIGENILFASHKFSKPKIMNSGKKQLIANASLSNLLTFHHSIQLLCYQVQINPTTQNSHNRFK